MRLVTDMERVHRRILNIRGGGFFEGLNITPRANIQALQSFIMDLH